MGLLVILILFERKNMKEVFYWGNSQISSSWFPNVISVKSRANVYVTICYCFFFVLLGTFVKFKKKTILSFVMSVCPSAWKNSAPTGRIFMKFDIWVFFENLSKKIDVLWNMRGIAIGTLRDDVCTFMIISGWIICRMRNISDKRFIQNQNTVLYSIIFSQKIVPLWDNVEK